MNVFSLGVCTGGLDLSSKGTTTSEGYADMLINMYPKEGDLVLRSGSSVAYRLQGGTPIQTLHVHKNLSGRETLLCCAGGGIYSVDSCTTTRHSSYVVLIYLLLKTSLSLK